MKKLSKSLSFLMALLMIVSCFGGVSVFAEDGLEEELVADESLVLDAEPEEVAEPAEEEETEEAAEEIEEAEEPAEIPEETEEVEEEVEIDELTEVLELDGDKQQKLEKVRFGVVPETEEVQYGSCQATATYRVVLPSIMQNVYTEFSPLEKITMESAPNVGEFSFYPQGQQQMQNWIKVELSVIWLNEDGSVAESAPAGVGVQTGSDRDGYYIYMSTNNLEERTQAGTYNFKVVATYSSLYYSWLMQPVEMTVGTAKLVVNPIVAEIKWTANKVHESKPSCTYDGTEFTYNATVENIATGDTVNTITKIEKAGKEVEESVDAGEYTKTVTGLDNPNYALPEGEGAKDLKKTYTIDQLLVQYQWGTLSFIYNGKMQSPAKPAITNVVGDDDVYVDTMQYEGDETNYYAGNADKYGMHVRTLAGKDAANYKLDSTSVEWEIKPLTITSATLTKADFTYTGKKIDVLADNNLTVLAGEGILDTPLTLTIDKDFEVEGTLEKHSEGDYTFYVKAKSNNFTVKNGSIAVNWKIGHKLAEVVDAPQAQNWTYANTELPLVKSIYSFIGKSVIASAKGGTLMYAVTTTNEQPPVSAFSEEVPTAKDAGTYYVWYYVLADKDHTSTTAEYVVATISPRVLTVNWDEEVVFTYDAKEHAPVPSLVKNPIFNFGNPVDETVLFGLDGYDDVDIVVTNPEVNAGEYTAVAKLTGKDAGNYVIRTDYELQKFEIEKADLVVSAPTVAKDWVYDGKVKELIDEPGSVWGVELEDGKFEEVGEIIYGVTTVAAGEGQVGMPNPFSAELSTDIPTGKDAQKYIVVFQVEFANELAANNYNVYNEGRVKSVGVVTVEKAQVTVSATAKDKKFDKTDKAELDTLTVKGVAEGEKITVDPATLTLTFAQSKPGKNIKVTLDASKADAVWSEVETGAGDPALDAATSATSVEEEPAGLENYVIEYLEDAGTADIFGGNHKGAQKDIDKNQPPKTGDDSAALLWAGLALSMGIGATAIVLKKKEH